MRSIIMIVMGSLLLMSAASAIGNDNIATVSSTDEMTGNTITAASFAQMNDIDANLEGNLDTAAQTMFLRSTDNSLTGSFNNNGFPDGRTFFIQSGDMMLNDTGNINNDLQIELLGANENLVTQGNITQSAAQIDNDKGNNNGILQFTGAGIGVVLEEFGSPNVLTGSELNQLSCLDVSVTGNTNTAIQADLQGAFDNTMTDSKLWQQNSANAEISGNSNAGPIIIVPILQGSVQVAADNTMTKSWAYQLDCQNENVAGNTNTVGQLSFETMALDTVTMGGVLQKINGDIDALGNTNTISQSETFTSSTNTVIDGNILQQADVFTSS